MDEKINNFNFDFMPIGQAIKKAREAKGMTREQLSGIIGYAPRHIQAIENEGQYLGVPLSSLPTKTALWYSALSKIVQSATQSCMS